MDIVNWSTLPVLTRSTLADGDKILVRDVSVTEESAAGGLASITTAELQASRLNTLSGADAGTLAIPIVSGTYVLTKGSAGAYTLAAPTAAQAGTMLVITNGTAYAHTITATSLVWDGTTGVNTTITFAAFQGSTITLVAYNLLWNVVAQNTVTSVAP
jgi:hypothetical protein